MNIDFVSIIAALVLILPTAFALILWYMVAHKDKRIKHLESCKTNLSELLAVEKESTSNALYVLSEKHKEAQEDIHQTYIAEGQQLTSRINELQGQLMALTVEPLVDIKDEDLAHVVKKELTKRVKLQRQATLPWGNVAHKLATQVGGACFRVVDHCKRGHGEFQAYGPYHAPKAESTVELEA